MKRTTWFVGVVLLVGILLLLRSARRQAADAQHERDREAAAEKVTQDAVRRRLATVADDDQRERDREAEREKMRQEAAKEIYERLSPKDKELFPLVKRKLENAKKGDRLTAEELHVVGAIYDIAGPLDSRTYEKQLAIFGESEGFDELCANMRFRVPAGERERWSVSFLLLDSTGTQKGCERALALSRIYKQHGLAGISGTGAVDVKDDLFFLRKVFDRFNQPVR